MIERRVYRRTTSDTLICTDCLALHAIDRTHHVALNLVGHRCGDPTWTIPPRPVRNKKRASA